MVVTRFDPNNKAAKKHDWAELVGSKSEGPASAWCKNCKVSLNIRRGYIKLEQHARTKKHKWNMLSEFNGVERILLSSSPCDTLVSERNADPHEVQTEELVIEPVSGHAGPLDATISTNTNHESLRDTQTPQTDRRSINLEHEGKIINTEGLSNDSFAESEALSDPVGDSSVDIDTESPRKKPRLPKLHTLSKTARKKYFREKARSGCSPRKRARMEIVSGLMSMVDDERPLLADVFFPTGSVISSGSVNIDRNQILRNDLDEILTSGSESDKNAIDALVKEIKLRNIAASL